MSQGIGGMIPNTPVSIRKLVKKLKEKENLRVCYETGPIGYGLAFQPPKKVPPFFG